MQRSGGRTRTYLVRVACVFVVVSVCSCKSANRTEAEIASIAADIDKLRGVAEAKRQSWHKALAAALETKPSFGEPCPVDYDAGYPVEFFEKPWHGAVLRGGFRPDSAGGHVQKARTRARRIEEMNKPGLSVYDEPKKLAEMTADSFWTHELSFLTLEEFIPKQSATGKIKSGSRLVRAILYSYADEKIICEGIYVVGNGDKINFSYTSYGTAADHARERQQIKDNKGKLGKRGTSLLVRLDLAKKSYFGAKSKLFEVVSRSPLVTDKPAANEE